MARADGNSLGAASSAGTSKENRGERGRECSTRKCFDGQCETASAQQLTHRDHTIVLPAMFTYEVAETELDASEGMVSGAESEKADDLAEGLQWFAASSLRHLSTDLEPLHLPLATSAPNVPLECTPARLLPSALRHDHLELIFFYHK